MSKNMTYNKLPSTEKFQNDFYQNREKQVGITKNDINYVQERATV
jgi:hypothetical protein